ncbi:MAG: hypothetical protein L0Y39_09040 [Methylococcaceae bacterium]|nr:hypothetical protein [Methylococcaceae bacterium]
MHGSIHVRRCVKAVALFLALVLSDISAAADKELLNILLKNGIINQQQHDSLSQKAGDAGGNDLLEILQQNGAITKDQFTTLSKKQNAATMVAALRPRPKRRMPRT